jgi:hypothetical protein
MVHIRVPLTDEGDVYEDNIRWDLTDPLLLDPEGYVSIKWLVLW